MKKISTLLMTSLLLTLSLSCSNNESSESISNLDNSSLSTTESDEITSSSSVTVSDDTSSVTSESSLTSSSESTSSSTVQYDIISVAEALSIAASLKSGESTSQKYYVEGTINDIYNSTYGNCHLIDELSSSNNDLILYGVYNYNGQVRYDSMANKPVAGDKVIAYGSLMNYYDSKNSVNKYEMCDAWIMSINGTDQSNINTNTSEDTSSGGSIAPIDPIDGEFVINENAWTYSGNYYSQLNHSYTGSDLKSALNKIIMHTNKGYANLKNGYKLSDSDQTNTSKVILYYTGESRAWGYDNFSGSINREHVWPQSKFGSSKSLTDSPYADIYNVRPSDKNYNSQRGNQAFDYTTFVPPVAYRGDVARIIFYVATRYSNLTIVDSTVNDSYSMGKLSTLLEWNLQYPVSDLEIRRNNGGQQHQSNRNPFVDNPSFACSIWGNTNSTTKNICSGK